MAHAAAATVPLRRPLLLLFSPKPTPTRLLSSSLAASPSSPPHPRALRPVGRLLPSSDSAAQDLDPEDGGASVPPPARRIRNEMKREARRAVRWGMELAKLSPPQIERVVRAASLEREVLDALMLVKRFGPDVREGRRRQFNYIGRLLLRGDAQPELMETLIQACKDGDDRVLQQALLSSEEDTLLMEDSEQVEEEDDDHGDDEEYMEIADRWFEGLLCKDISVTNEVYAVHDVEFDCQELRKLVRRVHMLYESTRNEDDTDMKLSRAKKPLLMSLRSLAKKTSIE